LKICEEGNESGCVAWFSSGGIGGLKEDV